MRYSVGDGVGVGQGGRVSDSAADTEIDAGVLAAVGAGTPEVQPERSAIASDTTKKHSLSELTVSLHEEKDATESG